jgi:phosphatidylethanolamine/phosphatidyl-N-methylethanolamine N-methyltransferase
VDLQLNYTLLAPFYDLFAGAAFSAARRESLAALPREGHCTVLLNGVGSGLDIPFLPRTHRYFGLDLTQAMLRRSVRRATAHDFSPVLGNSLALPFRDACFDHAVLHMILAVVPDAALALAETARVVRKGGNILVFDKFLRHGQRSPIRRLLNPLASRLATRLDVVLDDVLPGVPGVRVLSDRPATAGAWFRVLRLEKV